MKYVDPYLFNKLNNSLKLYISSFIYNPQERILCNSIKTYKKYFVYHNIYYDINKLIYSKLDIIEIYYINESCFNFIENHIALSFFIKIKSQIYRVHTYLSYNIESIKRLYNDKYIFILFCFQLMKSLPHILFLLYSFIINEKLILYDNDSINLFISKCRCIPSNINY